MAARDLSPDETGGRIFFSGAERSLVEEDTISLISAGVDIGSATTHLVLSRIELERLDTRYVVSEREVLYQSPIHLTPYVSGEDISTAALRRIFDGIFEESGVAREQIDTGALILTGVAVRRRNARAIAEMFARDAGKFVAVSAGDRLESLLAAHGSGALRASETGRCTLNIDIGGGTTKLSLCRNGRVEGMSVVEAGARLVVTDAAGQVERLEDYGARYARDLGLPLALGAPLSADAKRALAAAMADRIFDAVAGRCPPEFLRLTEGRTRFDHTGFVISGGVSEFLHRRTSADFGDLGPDLAAAIMERITLSGLPVLPGAEGIRATVLGASQQTVQMSGSTVFIDPLEKLPLRNVVNIRPRFDISGEEIDPAAVAASVRDIRRTFDLLGDAQSLAVSIDWQGSATYARLDALSRGIIAGLEDILHAGHPLVMLCDSDVGGLLGMHCRENDLCANAVVSVDGLDLADFDFVDIGEVLHATGSVPVVVKSLVFPSENALPEKGDACVRRGT
ncbi:ethanolamine ammonia-lyase reactivating factor EutA [Actibacterium sp. MT2.3-13A]|uniref:ethanolamine ammonia-lyase reactivating factor EutA n=1 Tax=Actibacterium sp. MT2.3-13A TaxID=2828332 RepID=UPI001BAC604D|nr:ethanolamine ammonia-lyase reactivating factor EutA [Actibacterium sp. MT2.3-13A]